MPRPLKVFLCHASQDKPDVRKMYFYLKQHGVQPWLDREDLLPGQDWEVEIPKAIFTSDVILVCLSTNSVNKEGYVQKEISFALDKALEKPEGTIFVIPVKLEECDVPNRLKRYQWVDYFRTDGRRRLLLSLYVRAEGLDEDISPVVLDVIRKTRTDFRYVASDIEKNRGGVTKVKNERNGIEKKKSEKEVYEKLDSESRKQNTRDPGISASEGKDGLKSKEFQIIPPFFSSWKDMFIWLAFPLTLLIPAVILSVTITAGYEFIPIDKRGAQLLIWIVYFLLIVIYTWFSHYHVPFLYFGINKVDLREKSNDIKNEKCVTRDLIVITAELFVTWQINDPILSLTKISELEDSMFVLSTAILHTAIAEYTIQETMKKRQTIKNLVRTRIENIAKNWGVQINNLQLNL